jgi:hypothetical protein
VQPGNVDTSCKLTDHFIQITLITPVVVKITACAPGSREHDTLSSSLSIGGRSVWPVHISPLFRLID